MDAAQTRGDEQNFPQRRDLSLSFFYAWYRVGVITTSLVVALLPRRLVNDLFPILLTASSLSLALCVISTLAFPREAQALQPVLDIESTDSDSSSFESFDSIKKEKEIGEPSFKNRVLEHLHAALFSADRRLLACYVEILYYGIAFGQLNSVTSSFFNEVVFKAESGDWRGIKWASYAALAGRGLSIILDAILPRLVFRKNAYKFTMTVAWACGAFFGAALFFSMMFINTAWPALIVFGALYVTTSTHNLFSLLSCGSLVLPKYRATSFGVRAGCLNLGVLMGTAIAGFILQNSGWRWVMLHSSTACFGSGLAAAFSGSVERADYAGVAANANALAKYLVQRSKDRFRRPKE